MKFVLAPDSFVTAHGSFSRILVEGSAYSQLEGSPSLSTAPTRRGAVGRVPEWPLTRTAPPVSTFGPHAGIYDLLQERHICQIK